MKLGVRCLPRLHCGELELVGQYKVTARFRVGPDITEPRSSSVLHFLSRLHYAYHTLGQLLILPQKPPCFELPVMVGYLSQLH